MYGFEDTALKWFEQFLEDRQFKVSVNNKYSETKTFNFSVAQGSCSGPVLFCLYSSTLPKLIPAGINLQAFADDHTISKGFKLNASEINSAKLCLEETLYDIHNWMKENRLKMNNKTEFIIFGGNHYLRKCNWNVISMIDELVQKSQCIRLLGAWLDSRLTFSEHATRKCKSAMWNLQKLRSIRKYLDINTCKILVDSPVTSHLDYCNSLLFGTSDYILSKLQRVQNIAAKLILMSCCGLF